jgi:hypothetical protein
VNVRDWMSSATSCQTGVELHCPEMVPDRGVGREAFQTVFWADVFQEVMDLR